jgi:hypothetical protein
LSKSALVWQVIQRTGRAYFVKKGHFRPEIGSFLANTGPQMPQKGRPILRNGNNYFSHVTHFAMVIWIDAPEMQR